MPQLPTDMNLKDVVEVGCKTVLNMQSRTELPSIPNIPTMVKIYHAELKKPQQGTKSANGLK